jgi:hypothetical protein
MAALNRPLVRFSIAELQERLKDSELEEPERIRIVEELERKRMDEITQRMQEDIQKLTKPHWTLVPGFWVIVVAMLLAAIAAWPVIQGWLPTLPPAHTNSSSLPQ